MCREPIGSFLPLSDMYVYILFELETLYLEKACDMQLDKNLLHSDVAETRHAKGMTYKNYLRISRKYFADFLTR